MCAKLIADFVFFQTRTAHKIMQLLKKVAHAQFSAHILSEKLEGTLATTVHKFSLKANYRNYLVLILR